MNGLSTKDWLRAIGIKDSVRCTGPNKNKPEDGYGKQANGNVNKEFDF